MAVLMDDPTTYLKRDRDVPCIVLAGGLGPAMEQARMYGVSIQCHVIDALDYVGVNVVSNQAEAMLAITLLPAATPWCIVNDGLWEASARDVLTSWFGPPVAMDKALGVVTDGIAWNPTRKPVYNL